MKDDEGVITDDSQSKASILNDYFGIVFSRDNEQMPTTGISRCADADKLQNMYFTLDMILKLLHSTKPKYTTGVDGHPAIFNVKCSFGLSLPLSMLYNLSMSTSTIPSDWKHSVITPVFKKGSSNDPSNYHSIASTCIASKIMEGCIKNEVIAHMFKYGFISKRQHGFLAKH